MFYIIISFITQTVFIFGIIIIPVTFFILIPSYDKYINKLSEIKVPDYIPEKQINRYRYLYLKNNNSYKNIYIVWNILNKQSFF